MKLPRVTGDKVIKALLRAGFSVVHVRGSHHYLHRPEHDWIVTVPVHPKKALAPKTLKSIHEEAHVSAEEFFALLQSILFSLFNPHHHLHIRTPSTVLYELPDLHRDPPRSPAFSLPQFSPAAAPALRSPRPRNRHRPAPGP